MTADGVILAVESATGGVGCAVGHGGELLAEARSVRHRRHAESLAPQISFVLDQAGLTPADLTTVAVDVGPGLYTGLRVGVTTALAIAHTLDIDMVAASSLDVLARGVAFHDGEAHAVIDARRGELFHAAYETGGGVVRRRSDPAVVDPTALAADLEGRRVVVVGDGLAAQRDAFAACDVVEVNATPAPVDLLRLAAEEKAAGRTVAPSAVRPCYLRRPDAVAKWGAAS